MMEGYVETIEVVRRPDRYRTIHEIRLLDDKGNILGRLPATSVNVRYDAPGAAGEAQLGVHAFRIKFVEYEDADA